MTEIDGEDKANSFPRQEQFMFTIQVIPPSSDVTIHQGFNQTGFIYETGQDKIVFVFLHQGELRLIGKSCVQDSVTTEIFFKNTKK